MSDEQQTPKPPEEKRSLEERIEARREKIETRLEETRDQVKAKLKKVERSIAARITRGTLWTIGGIVAFLLVVFGIFAWYTTTADFEGRVRTEIVAVLGDTTGGRVELKQVHFDLWHLAVEVDGLVIHGLEAEGEAPYLSVDRVLLRVKIRNFFSRVVSKGVASYISLNYLRVEHPQFHLIVDKDGKTNQPVPKHPTKSSEPVTDTLLDLRAQKVELVNGVALINQRSIPFDLAARDLDAEVHYLFHTDRYAATIDLRDLRTRLAKEPEAQSALHLEAELGRDEAVLERFELHTGKSSQLQAKGTLKNFANPEWQANASGLIEVKQIAVLTGLDTLKAGTIDLNVQARNCIETTPQEVKKPPLWQRIRPKLKGKPDVKAAPVLVPGCPAAFVVAGSAKVQGAGYHDPYVSIHDVEATTKIHATPAELELSEMTAALPGGGTVTGDLRIESWLGAAPSEPASVATTAKNVASTTKSSGSKAPASAPAKSEPSHAYIDAMLNGIPLRTIMDVTAEHYGDLGFDTAVGGPVKVEWGGSKKDVADTVEVDGNLELHPTGVHRKGASSDVPVTGRVLAHYTGSNETVKIQQILFQTPKSTIEGSGILGVNIGDPLTQLHVDLTAHDLAEYNQLLTTLGLESNGKKGSAAIPVSLHGALHFTGMARGAARNLDVKGHVEASNIEFAMGSTDALIDSLVADAEYSPSSGIAVANSTIHRGSAVLHASGTVEPRREVSRRGVVSYVWDDTLSMDATVDLANAQVPDLLQIVGQQQKIPITGTVSANAHVTGTMENLNGTGHLQFTNGVAYDEPYESISSNLAIHGKAIEATQVVLKAHGMQLSGNGGYDLASEHLHGHIEGHDLDLAKFEAVKRSGVNADGRLTLVADANGTITEPGLHANLKLANVVYQGQAVGEAVAEAHSQGKVMYFTADSTIVGAKVGLNGQTQLTGNYQTDAKLTIADFDVSRPLGMFGPGNIKAQSSISGIATVSGPLKSPKELGGAAELNNVDVKLQGVELKAAEPLRISLRSGVATLDQVHITGQDTDMRLGGTAQLFGSTDPKGGKLNIKGSGNISMAVLHTFDPDILSSGKVEFTVAAGGQVTNPALSGKVQFDSVNLALDGVPNGLSDMNGTLIFTDDRLQVQSLTAKTGGGDLKIGGSLRFRNGIYADLTATGEAVRVRLYGLSATANANLKLQGTSTSSLLSGNILITRFGVGQDVDFAAFAGSGSTISAPTDPNAPSNKVRLDVRVTSAPQLDFQNSYAKLAGSVDLNIRGTIASPSILGRIQITDGSATFANTKYQLQRGDIYFTNPVRIDPTIDIDATAQVENYEVTVGLHGTASNLKPTYRSEPPLSEADVFALLALGRTQEEAQLYQEKQLQAGTDPTTSALLGGALNATVSSRVEKLFGVGSVKIDPAFVGTLGNSSARITIQEQISKQITATFATNVNTSAQQLIQVQYDLTHNSSIVVTRDESGVFSIVYKLRRRYR
ncbi:translocation/assembly module TamB domain-containing protein [Edaphobacter flagellatus]|uniref:translocation/assembly module TamB domain-containing protein n=1 Tax=Edaphobacter flagellatus TaxID=1933044 RepID=UPI0021B29585|nr:translocation/assembly module TamB domain-containing protein [Edaphobacter flagellatus]